MSRYDTADHDCYCRQNLPCSNLSGLPFSDVLSEDEIQDAFDQEDVSFAQEDDGVYTPSLTLWAFLSQVMHKGELRSFVALEGTSCKGGRWHDREYIESLTRQIVGNRPGRFEPRAVKRRPKPLRLLNITRDKAREQLRKGVDPFKKQK